MEKSAAIVTIKDAGSMTQEGREQIAQWLRRHADMLIEDGWNYSARFTGRYMYIPVEK